MTELKDLYTAVVEMQEETAMTLTRSHLDSGVAAADIVGCYQEALEEIGKRIELQIYFITELILVGEMMKAGTEMLRPHLADQDENPDGNDRKHPGEVPMVTVAGDIRGIGKNVVTMMIELDNPDVRDIGGDMPADGIIDEELTFGTGAFVIETVLGRNRVREWLS